MSNYVISLRLTIMTLVFAFFASQVTAATVSSVGDNFSLNFFSKINDVVVPGLTSSADITLASITPDGMGGETWTLDVSLSNTSTPPVTNSRVSIFGFNIDANYDSGDSSVSGIFDVLASGNMPTVGDLDVCVKASGGSNNCAGGGSGGVDMGDTGLFSLALNFDSPITALTLDDFYVRYQSGGQAVIGEIPAPASIFLMTSALAALAGVGKSRKLRE